MSNQIAVGQCSTEEDLDIEWSFAAGYDPTGKTFEVLVRERTSATIKATLTVGSGLTIVGAAVKAKVAKATMAAWARMEYTADLVDKTGGTPKRLVPTRITFDEPGKLVGGVSGNSFQIAMAGNRFVITATRGETGPVGPATTLTIGTVTDIAPGNPPSASLTGPAGAQVLSLGLVRGTPGSGAPDSPDILAIAEKDRLERALAAAGVADGPNLIVDFIRGVQFATGSAISASLVTLATAIGGVSGFGRSSTATYWGSDGLLKTASNNVPRVEFDPLTRQPLGLLLENQSRTNLIPYAMLGSGATLGGATLTPAASVFVDGTTRMSRLTNTATNGTLNSSICDVYPAVPNDGSAWTFSTFLRQGSSPKSTLMLGFAGGVAIQSFLEIDWATKTATGPGRLWDLGGGRYLASITFANNASGNTAAICRVYTRDAGATHVVGEYVDIGGYQLENGPGRSSFIETSGSAATRAGEALSFGPGSWLRAGPLTACLDYSLTEARAGTLSFPIALNNPTYDSQLLFREGASIPGVDVGVVSGGAPQFFGGATASTVGQVMRLACGYSTSDWGYARDNVLVSSGGAISIPTGLSRLDCGTGGFMGHLRRMLFYSQRLSNSKVQALSNQAAWS